MVSGGTPANSKTLCNRNSPILTGIWTSWLKYAVISEIILQNFTKYTEKFKLLDRIFVNFFGRTVACYIVS